MNTPRVVITGMGAVSPLGLTVHDLWAGLCAGKCGISKITAFDPGEFPCKLAGQLPDTFKVQNYVPKSYRKSVKLMARDIELAVAAAKEAFESSGLITKGIDETRINIDPKRMAIDLGAGLMSCDLVELGPAIEKSITNGSFDIRKWGKDGIEALTPLWLLKYLPNMLACHIGILHDIQGPSNTITCAEVASHLAMAEAMQIIQRGAADIAITGGGEAKVNAMGIMRQCLTRRAATRYNDTPQAACRPFDTEADGSIFGEAAAILVLESLENAQKRNAKIYGELVGMGQSQSLNTQYEHLESDGKAIQIAIEQALSLAGITAEQLDLILPHGTGIAADDAAEAKGILAALGKAGSQIPVLPTKSMLCNTSAASGAIDTIVALCAMADGKIPAAKNCTKKAAGCDLNIVRTMQQCTIRYALCCGYTYGGQTAAVVIKNWQVKQ
ncbi:MAG: beta-ketoacyl-[acyl-carrier-protein] synthase family protein [Sedimentisphaerales bacterium]|nr:beta-ketoacyl-[acyl-carrier-protein] synthase family protein [Sedimentisphaerales bacterium]